MPWHFRSYRYSSLQYSTLYNAALQTQTGRYLTSQCDEISVWLEPINATASRAPFPPHIISPTRASTSRARSTITPKTMAPSTLVPPHYSLFLQLICLRRAFSKRLGRNDADDTTQPRKKEPRKTARRRGPDPSKPIPAGRCMFMELPPRKMGP